MQFGENRTYCKELIILAQLQRPEPSNFIVLALEGLNIKSRFLFQKEYD